MRLAAPRRRRGYVRLYVVLLDKDDEGVAMAMASEAVASAGEGVGVGVEVEVEGAWLSSVSGSVSTSEASSGRWPLWRTWQ